MILKTSQGNCGDLCASKHDITRKDQDDFAILSYKRATEAWEKGKFDEEVVPCVTGGRQPKTVSKDEEYSGLKLDKVPSLRAAFNKDGTVTAANASKLNDGASAFILASGKFAKEHGLKPLFKIKGFGDAARDPVEFTIAPADAVPRALKNAGMTLGDVHYHEINEAFSVVALANARLLGLDIDKVNVHGGAVALGHPIGSSGSRIIGTLYHVLKAQDQSVGCASICNGGGGASAIIIERLN